MFKILVERKIDSPQEKKNHKPSFSVSQLQMPYSAFLSSEELEQDLVISTQYLYRIFFLLGGKKKGKNIGGGGGNFLQHNRFYILKYSTHQTGWSQAKWKSRLTTIQSHCSIAIYNNVLPAYQKYFFSGFEIVLLSISLKNNAFASFNALYLKFFIHSTFIFQVILILVSTCPTPPLKTGFLPTISAARACKQSTVQTHCY